MFPPSLLDSELNEQPGTANQFGDGNRMFNNFGGSPKNIEGGNSESGAGGGSYEPDIGMALPKESTK